MIYKCGAFEGTGIFCYFWTNCVRKIVDYPQESLKSVAYVLVKF